MPATGEIMSTCNNSTSSLPPLAVNLCESEHRVGKYVMGKKIGDGKYSVVRKCSDLRNGVGNLAIKILSKEGLGKTTKKHAENEAKVLRLLQAHHTHKNVATFCDIIHGEKNFYFVLERYQSDLFEFLERFHSIIDKNVGGLLIVEIACGLEFLRGLNISHGDLKPENVLVNITPVRLVVKICDFGTAQIAAPGQLVARRTTGVTRGFFAPETLLCESHCPFRADIFSLGCIALEIILLETDFNKSWISNYTAFCNGTDSESTFRENIEMAIRRVRHLILVSMQFDLEPPSLLKSFRRDVVAADMGLQSSIHAIQSCIDIVPSRRSSLGSLLKCDWCRLADHERAIDTIVSGKAHMWPRSGGAIDSLQSWDRQSGQGAGALLVHSLSALAGGRDRSVSGDGSPRTITDDCIEDGGLNAGDMNIHFSEVPLPVAPAASAGRRPSDLCPHPIFRGGKSSCSRGPTHIDSANQSDAIATRGDMIRQASAETSISTVRTCSSSSLFDMRVDEYDSSASVSSMSSTSTYGDSCLDIILTDADSTGPLPRGFCGSVTSGSRQGVSPASTIGSSSWDIRLPVRSESESGWKASADRACGDEGDGDVKLDSLPAVRFGRKLLRRLSSRKLSQLSFCSATSCASSTGSCKSSALSQQLRQWSEVQDVKYASTVAVLSRSLGGVSQGDGTLPLPFPFSALKCDDSMGKVTRLPSIERSGTSRACGKQKVKVSMA